MTGNGAFRDGGGNGRALAARLVRIGAVTAGVLVIGVAVALAAFTTEQATHMAPYNVFTNVTAACQNGQHVGFGGFKMDNKVPFGSGPDEWMAAMAPNSTATKWTAEGTNVTAVYPGTISSIVYCETAKPPKVVSQKHIVLPSGANDELRTTSVSCPAGKVVIGGGWSAKTSSPPNQNQLMIMGLQRTTATTWQVTVINQTGAQAAVTAIALCGTQKSPKTVTASVSVQSDKLGTATATCPTGTSVVFGGLKGTDNSLSGANAFPFDFFLSSPRTISVTGGDNFVGSGNPPGNLEAIAYCT